MPTYVLYNDKSRDVDMESIADYLSGSDITIDSMEASDRSLEADMAREQQGRFEKLVQSQGFRYRIKNVYVYRPRKSRGS